MKKLLLILMLVTGSTAAGAQTVSPALGRCLADSTTGKDRKDLVRWIVVAIAQHPAMVDSITVSPAKVELINKTAAQIFMRLMTVDCKVELKAAYKSGGSKAIETAFGVLGEVAVQEVMADPEVGKAMDGLVKYVDLKKIGEALPDR